MSSTSRPRRAARGGTTASAARSARCGRRCGGRAPRSAHERVGRHAVAVDDGRVHAAVGRRACATCTRRIAPSDGSHSSGEPSGPQSVSMSSATMRAAATRSQSAASARAIGDELEAHGLRVEQRRRRAARAARRRAAAGRQRQRRVRLDALQPRVDERDLELAARARLDRRPVARRAERGLDDDARRVRLERLRDRRRSSPVRSDTRRANQARFARRRPQAQRRVRAARRAVQHPQRDAPPRDAAPARDALAQQHAAVGHGRQHRAGARLHGEGGEGACVVGEHLPMVETGPDGAPSAPATTAGRRARARGARRARGGRRSPGRARGRRARRTRRARWSGPSRVRHDAEQRPCSRRRRRR